MWQEVLNTDAADYGGRGSGNLGLVYAKPSDGAAPVATLTLPALSTLWLRYQSDAHVPTVSHG